MPRMDWDAMATQDDEASKPAPPNVYVMVVEKATWGQSKKGAPQVTMIMRIAEGPFKGKTAWYWLTFDMDNPNTIRMARNFLKLSGVDFGDFGKLGEQEQLDFLVGKRYEVDLKVEAFQGEDRNKVKNISKGLAGGASTEFAPPPPIPTRDAATQPVNPLDGV